MTLLLDPVNSFSPAASPHLRRQTSRHQQQRSVVGSRASIRTQEGEGDALFRTTTTSSTTRKNTVVLASTTSDDRDYVRVPRRRKGGRRKYYEDDDEEDDDDDRYYDDRDDEEEYYYDDNDLDEDDDDDDDIDIDTDKLMENVLVPNPILDSIDPDGAADRFPELAKDPKFWFDMALFIAFLNFLSFAGPRDTFPDIPLY